METAAVRKNNTIYLEDIVRSLTVYAAGISGHDIQIVSADGTFDLGSSIKNQIPLPSHISANTIEESLLQYKMLATLEACILKASRGGIDINKLPKKWKEIISKNMLGRDFTYIDDCLRPYVSSSYLKSLSSLLQVIEFGRVRQYIAQRYPILNEDIDSFLTQKIKTIFHRDILREKLKRWDTEVVAHIMVRAMSVEQGSTFLNKEETEDALACYELAYLLLFSNPEIVIPEKRKSLPKTVKIYEKIFPIISKINATKSDSIALALDILNEDFDYDKGQVQPPDIRAEKREKLPLPEYPITMAEGGVSMTSLKRLNDDKKIKATIEERVIDSKIIKISVDEWDNNNRIYIRDICKIRKVVENEDSTVHPEFIKSHLERIAKLRGKRRFSFDYVEVAEIARILEVLKPEGKTKQKKLHSGEIDFNEWIKYKQARKIGENPEPKFYKRIERRERDVAQVLLWDISGSSNGYSSRLSIDSKMRIIDSEEFGVLHYAAAVRELGDDLAVLAYNSLGRDSISVYPLLEFGSEFNINELARRTGNMIAEGNNHDGAAIRYTLNHYLLKHSAATRILVHVNDGVPEDINKGKHPATGEVLHEYSGGYAIEDVKKALQECAAYDIITFGFSFAKETHREVMQRVWGRDYKMLKTPYGLGRKLAEMMVDKTLM